MNDWLLATVMGAVGIVMVAGAMTGWYPTSVELGLWTLVGVGWVLVARRRVARPWAVVVGAGIASGVFAGAMQAAFLDVLVENNEAWASYTVDGATRVEAFYSALPIGLVWGLLFGAVSWAMGRVVSRGRGARAA